VVKKAEVNVKAERVEERYNKTSYSEEKIIGIRSFSNNGVTSVGTSSFAPPTIPSGVSNSSAAESQISKMLRVLNRTNNMTS